jgi:hypothetical protein
MGPTETDEFSLIEGFLIFSGSITMVGLAILIGIVIRYLHKRDTDL